MRKLGFMLIAPGALLALVACTEGDMEAGNEMTTVQQGAPDAVPSGQEPDAEPAEPIGDEESDACGASRVQDYVGQEATNEIRAMVEAESGAENTRWINPDDIVTMDYSPTRLNGRLDADSRIESLTCG